MQIFKKVQGLQFDRLEDQKLIPGIDMCMLLNACNRQSCAAQCMN